MKQSDLKQRTIYLPQEVYELLGERSPELNEALTVWAELVAHALRGLENHFYPDEWEFLAEALAWRAPRPQLGAPGVALLQAVVAGSDAAEGLRVRIMALDTVEEWAVLYLCRWWQRHRFKLKLAGKPWWKQSYRLNPE